MKQPKSVTEARAGLIPASDWEPDDDTRLNLISEHLDTLEAFIEAELEQRMESGEANSDYVKEARKAYKAVQKVRELL